jgi:hypothetical protein
MSAHLLKHFHSQQDYCYAVVLAHGEPDILAILCLQYLDGAPEQGASLLSLSLFNLQSQKMEAVITYNGMGPDRLNSLATDALLSYDPLARRWIIAQLQGERYLGVRTVTKLPEGTYLLSPLCLLDSAQGERGMNPVLALECQENLYRVLYHPDVPGHTSAGEVRRTALSLHSALWEKQQEQAGVVATGEHRYTWQEWQHVVPVPPLETAYLEPEGVIFDPGTSFAHQTNAVSIQVQQAIAESENAMAYSTADFHLLALCCPEGWVQPRAVHASAIPPSQHGEWRIWFTNWDSDWTNHQWTYTSEISVPSDPSLPSWEYPAWPEADVALTPGPSVQQHATLVLVFNLQPIEGKTVQSQGVCVDTTGQVIQKCQDQFGRYPSLASCGDMIVGVDYQESGWRMWNWQVLQSTHLQKMLPLDPLCQRSYVHTEEKSSWFWLVEELPAGVRVSRRDAASLTTVADVVWLAGVKLLETQTELRPLNGYDSKGILPLNGELLLVVVDKQGELVLHRV